MIQRRTVTSIDLKPSVPNTGVLPDYSMSSQYEYQVSAWFYRFRIHFLTHPAFSTRRETRNSLRCRFDLMLPIVNRTSSFNSLDMIIAARGNFRIPEPVFWLSLVTLDTCSGYDAASLQVKSNACSTRHGVASRAARDNYRDHRH